jgi:beta-lactamase superfamily II metal-dependent hydrolase
MLDIIVFNVELGQSIFLYPHQNPQYGMLVDCGNTPRFDPVDFLIEKGLLFLNGQQYVLGEFVLTNYDQDHFSGLPYFQKRAYIKSIRFAKNLASAEIKAQKPTVTDALEHICDLQDTYTGSVTDYIPPFKCQAYSLTKSQLNGASPTTNNLSQMVFVEYHGSVICIAGDLEAGALTQLLAVKTDLKDWLKFANVLVAAHHGRENGYAEEIFDHCSPECVVISDKQVVHGTQEGMSQAYANRVVGNGVRLLSSQSPEPRKVLTTRKDGHIWIRFDTNGTRDYRTFSI